ncbi:YciI family protein [Jatrophihabitans sp. DSM 45814]
MKYMLMIYANQATWEAFSAEEQRKGIAEQDAFNKRFFESGELLGAYGLADAVAAKTVRVRQGAPTVTDGPYLESKEYLASYYLIDCDSEERAVELAAEMPWASVSAVELWPLLHEAGSEA